MMSQTVVVVVLFVVLLMALPWGIRWLQKRVPGVLPGGAQTGAPRLVSALAVGPQQRVVTVEVGPEGGKSWLVLGVTAQNIALLHTMPLPASSFAAAVAEVRREQPPRVPASFEARGG